MKVAVPQATISWEAAQAAVAAAVAKAEALGVRINVGVADASGNLVAFLRMPGAFPQSIAIAIDKAYTAGGFGLVEKFFIIAGVTSPIHASTIPGETPRVTFDVLMLG